MHVALSVDQEEFEQRICQGHAYMEYPDVCKGFKRLQTQRRWKWWKKGGIFVPRLKAKCQPNMMLCKPVVNWSNYQGFPPANPKLAKQGNGGSLFQHVGCRETGGYVVTCEKKSCYPNML